MGNEGLRRSGAENRTPGKSKAVDDWVTNVRRVTGEESGITHFRVSRRYRVARP
jgi:hypothetical protein